MNFNFFLAAHEGRTRTCELAAAPDACGHASADFAGGTWKLDHASRDTAPGVLRCTLSATVTGGIARTVAVGLRWTFENWSIANPVLIPGAVYAGNRFDALRRPYPPKIRDVGQRGDSSVLDIGDIPRLSDRPGRSHLDQTSLDAATPGIGIFFPERGEAFLLLTPQHSSHGPIGFELMESDDRTSAELLVLAPGFLHPVPGESATHISIGNAASSHLHPENARPVDLAAGETLRFEFELHRFPCADVHGLFERLFAHRAAMFPQCATPLPDLLPFSAAWSLLEAKHNAENWNEARGFYQVGLPWDARPDSDQASQVWQNGWCGGGITTLPMLQEGTATSIARARRNLDFLFAEGISAFGLFKAVTGKKGVWKADGCGVGGENSTACLVRRQGDCLHFALRQLLLLRERGDTIPTAWTAACRRAAEALCTVWEREREFGFLLDWETGRVLIHGSTSGALIPSALVLAADFFDEPRFFATAQAVAAHYRDNDLARGVTTGGPGDAVQAPDGESIFGLIESFIALHERTGDSTWLEAATRACHQGASWAISYPCAFPASSALGRLGFDARGAMIANAQNKCGVPGICTLSGQGILRTFRATGDVRLLDLLREIAHSLPQFLSREDRRIPTRITWGHPLPELPAGWMCERVNITPSWPEPLGEQAAYSCWCEVAMMLTWADLPGVYAQPDTGIIRCLDHVRAGWADDTRTALRLENPTNFPAKVRVMIETSTAAAKRVLPPNFATSLPVVEVPAHGKTRTDE